MIIQFLPKAGGETEMEKVRKSSLPIIGTEGFGLTEREVIKARSQAAEKVQRWREQINDGNEKLRETSRRALLYDEKELKALSIKPEDVLARAKTFYDRTAELGSSGLDGKELALRLGDEFPDLINFYELLRMKEWGYHLGQSVMLAAEGRQMRRGSGE